LDKSFPIKISSFGVDFGVDAQPEIDKHTMAITAENKYFLIKLNF
jgi:hypothetical protein